MIAFSARDWAAVALFLAGALVLFVTAVVISNLFRVVTSLKDLVDGITSETVPLIGEVGNTVRGVNKELERVDSIVGSVQRVATNVEVISDTVQAAVTNPLVKMLAFFAGMKRASKKMKEEKECGGSSGVSSGSGSVPSWVLRSCAGPTGRRRSTRHPTSRARLVGRSQGSRTGCARPSRWVSKRWRRPRPRSEPTSGSRRSKARRIWPLGPVGYAA
jgi:hypothetical protein